MRKGNESGAAAQPEEIVPSVDCSERSPLDCVDHVFLHEHGFRLSERARGAFFELLRNSDECRGAGPTPALVRFLFRTECLDDRGFYVYGSHELRTDETAGLLNLILKIKYRGQGALLHGSGRNTSEAIVDALALRFEIESCEPCEVVCDKIHENVVAAKIVTWHGAELLGFGTSHDKTAAAIKAVLAAVNRALGRGILDDTMPVTEACSRTTRSLP